MLVCARLLLVALQAGCYLYVPATLETVPTGSRVRALISPAAEDRLRTTYGIEGRTLTGSLLSRDADQVSLYVPSVPMGTGLGNKPLYQQVPVPSADILRLDTRRLDAFRTGVVLVAAGGLLLAAGRKAFGGGSGGNPPGGGVPPESVVRGWVVRIPIAWP